MEDLAASSGNKSEVIPSLVRHVSKEYTDVDILRKAYELILENSDLFFNELEKSFKAEREKREFNPTL